MSVEKAQDVLERAMNAHTAESMQAFATVAVAEATLALAEQQRIANVIAMAQFHLPGPSGRLFTGMELATRWHAQAAKDLGLS